MIKLKLLYVNTYLNIVKDFAKLLCLKKKKMKRKKFIEIKQ